MPLSARELELIRALYTPSTFGERLFGAAPDRTEIIRECASLGNPEAAIAIAPLALSSDASLAQAAAAAIDALVRDASDITLAELDDSARRGAASYSHPYLGHWRSMAPAGISRFRRFGDAELSVVGIASFHASGWVRETALARLNDLGSPRVLPFLLLRVADWVAPVAARARAAFERRIVPDNAHALIANLPLLLRVTARLRRDTGDLRERVFTLLRDESPPEVLAEARRSADRTTRRLAFRLSAQQKGIDRVALLSEALSDRDTAIRLEAVMQARSLDRDTLTRLLPLMLADAFPKVRQVALGLGVDALGKETDAFILVALDDPNFMVREPARAAALERRLVDDFAAFYRGRAANAQSTRTIAAAVHGLGEVGTSDDVETIVEYLAHGRPRVRAAAVYALTRVDERVAVERLPAILSDPAPGVTHAVRESLRPMADRIGFERISALFERIDTKHGRRDAFLIGAALSKWDALPFLIEGAADSDEDIRTLAGMALDRWIGLQNRTFMAPTQDQLRAMEAILETHRLALPQPIVTELRSILRFWNR